MKSKKSKKTSKKDDRIKMFLFDVESQKDLGVTLYWFNVPRIGEQIRTRNIVFDVMSLIWAQSGKTVMLGVKKILTPKQAEKELDSMHEKLYNICGRIKL